MFLGSERSGAFFTESDTPDFATTGLVRTAVKRAFRKCNFFCGLAPLKDVASDFSKNLRVCDMGFTLFKRAPKLSGWLFRHGTSTVGFPLKFYIGQVCLVTVSCLVGAARLALCRKCENLKKSRKEWVCFTKMRISRQPGVRSRSDKHHATSLE